MKVTEIIGKLFLGKPGVYIEPQGWRQVPIELEIEWDTPTYGLMRPFKVIVIVTTMLFPVIHIDQLLHWFLPRLSTDRRFLTSYRDLYHVLRTYILYLGLFYYSDHKWVEFIALYFIAEIVHGAVATFLVWSARVIHPARSVIVAFWSYVESILAFAIIYLRHPCWFKEPLSATKALYFSTVTATTTGYGDITPINDDGYQLVLCHIAVSVLFILLVFNALLSRIYNNDGNT